MTSMLIHDDSITMKLLKLKLLRFETSTRSTGQRDSMNGYW